MIRSSVNLGLRLARLLLQRTPASRERPQGAPVRPYALAIVARDDGGLFYLASHSVALPLMLLGGVLLPMEMPPGWLQAASRLNPVAHLV
jgi:hypothetical protein